MRQEDLVAIFAILLIGASLCFQGCEGDSNTVHVEGDMIDNNAVATGDSQANAGNDNTPSSDNDNDNN